MSLGGRAAEWIHFGHLSTGASDDLKKVTQLAYARVSTYGMLTVGEPEDQCKPSRTKDGGDGGDADVPAAATPTSADGAVPAPLSAREPTPSTGGGRRNVSFPPPSDLQLRKPYSEKLANQMDEEVRAFLAAAFERTCSVLNERREEVRRVAEWLLRYEVRGAGGQSRFMVSCSHLLLC